MKTAKMFLCVGALLCAGSVVAKAVDWNADLLPQLRADLDAAGTPATLQMTPMSMPAVPGDGPAIEVYNCDFTATRKGDSGNPWTKKTFLSTQFANKIDFAIDRNAGTDLTLRVEQGGQLSGSVNEQHNFVVRGSVSDGYFESAYHTGKIACGQPVKVPYLLKFTPWDQFFTLDKELAKGHILDSVELANIQYENLCFIGDVRAAEQAISGRVGVAGQIANPYKISYTFTVQECIDSVGNCVDNWQCLKWKPHEITRYVRDCYEDENARP